MAGCPDTPPFILRMLGFDLEIVNAVTYVIISNIFHGYV